MKLADYRLRRKGRRRAGEAPTVKERKLGERNSGLVCGTASCV